MNQKKITKILDFFFAFNYVEDSDSLMVFESQYEDDYFRWTTDTFKHGYKLTALFNGKRILLFGTEKVRDRIVGNRDKVKSNEKKTHFGCSMEVVKDLVYRIPFETMTDDEIFEIDVKIQEMKEKNVIRAKEIAEHEAEMKKVNDYKERQQRGRARVR